MTGTVAASSTATDRSVSRTVVDAVAELTESDRLELDPLYDTVDPEALDALFETHGLGSDGSAEEVTFEYEGCEVVVSTDGTVRASTDGRSLTRRWA